MISIIIPIYNVSTYLPQCLDSVLSQTYKDLEIILVNDGSKDNSGLLCDEYAEKDPRIKVIHKDNGGLSDARNVGTAQATGDWIFYLDSDDWIESDALEILIKYAKQNNCDVTQGGLYYTYPDYLLKRKEEPSVVLGRNAAMKELIINDRVKNFAWGKLYKTALVKDLLFPKGKYFEDCYWQHLVIDRVNRYGIIDTPLVYYRQREDSISGTTSDRILDLLEGNKFRLDFVKEKYPQYVNLMKNTISKLEISINLNNNRKWNIIYFFYRLRDKFFPKVKYLRIER